MTEDTTPESESTEAVMPENEPNAITLMVVCAQCGGDVKVSRLDGTTFQVELCKPCLDALIEEEILERNAYERESTGM